MPEAKFPAATPEFPASRRQSRKYKQAGTAIDAMAHGVCMFDASERLVICNAKDDEMYGLTPMRAMKPLLRIVLGIDAEGTRC
jgi:PAS domain-containing protein